MSDERGGLVVEVSGVRVAGCPDCAAKDKRIAERDEVILMLRKQLVEARAGYRRAVERAATAAADLERAREALRMIEFEGEADEARIISWPSPRTVKAAVE